MVASMNTRLTKILTIVLLALAFTMLAFQSISAGDGARCSGACAQADAQPTPPES
jgi:hypothetical protein